jgi:hypothetical protein
VTSNWFFFFFLNYDARSSTHQNKYMLIGNLQIKSGYNVFTASVLLQAGCTAMNDVTLSGGNLLTQNCTSVTVVKICVCSLMLVSCVLM